MKQGNKILKTTITKFDASPILLDLDYGLF
jgi:hypothetical protein